MFEWFFSLHFLLRDWYPLVFSAFRRFCLTSGHQNVVQEESRLEFHFSLCNFLFIDRDRHLVVRSVASCTKIVVTGGRHPVLWEDRLCTACSQKHMSCCGSVFKAIMVQIFPQAAHYLRCNCIVSVVVSRGIECLTVISCHMWRFQIIFFFSSRCSKSE